MGSTSRAVPTSSLCILFASTLFAVNGLLAQELAEGAKAKSATTSSPANRWVVRPTSGWKGKTNYGKELWFGATPAKGKGVLVLSLERKKGVAEVWRLDPESGAWHRVASDKISNPYLDHKFKKYPVHEMLHGMQVCYDSDREVLVGRTSTCLDGRGRTVEFDLKTKKFAAFEAEPSPPLVTAASLCYDPVNKEVVLATGGFSPIGGTDGTWLYTGTERKWRKLECPAEVEAVRVPLAKSLHSLKTLRWLLWKNLEFRVTGRDKLLEARELPDALAASAAKLAGELKDLRDLATGNAKKAKRPYHRAMLAVAAKCLTGAAADMGGADAVIRSATPEQLEGLYRGKVLTALGKIEHALEELAVTPEPRMSSKLVYDSKNKVIVCFGGDGQDRGLNDTWVYHCESRWWERKQWQAVGIGGASRAMAFDEKNGLAVRLQGRRKHGHHVGWKVCAYDVAANAWVDTGLAAAKDMFWLTYDPVNACLVGLNGTMSKSIQVMKLNASALKKTPIENGPRRPIGAPNGQYVLRDVATVAHLKKWRGAQSAWVKGVPANTWVKVPTNGTGRPNWGRTWSSIVYDPDRLQIYYKGGGHGSYHGAVTDHYDLATGRWFRSDRRYHPPWPMGTYFAWGRSFSLAPWAVHTYKYGLFYHPLRKRMQRGIGQSGRMAKGVGTGNVEYDPDTGMWAKMLVPTGGRTGGAFGGGVSVPGVPDGLVCINNFSRYGTKDGEGRYLTAEGAKIWTKLGRLPRAFNDHNFCWFFDPRRSRAMYYGGSRKKKLQLFALDVKADAPKWVDLKAKAAGGELPLGSREVVYVKKHDVFLMIEGKSKAMIIHALDPKTNTFRKLDLSVAGGVKTKSHGWANGLQYDPVSDLCYFIGASGSVPVMQAFRYVP